jgi:hypothetical protein
MSTCTCGMFFEKVMGTYALTNGHSNQVHIYQAKLNEFISKPTCASKVVHAKSYLLIIVFSKYLVCMFSTRTQIMRATIVS